MNIKAYAKFNLTLDVKQKRSDGYHELSSVMQEISIYDEIALLVKNGKGENCIEIKCGNANVPCNESNTCYRAAMHFFEHFGVKNKLLKMTIKKGIPIGAGLGGGSSDAAAVICALNKMLGIGAEISELEKVASLVGADVPFFICGGMQRAGGFGEKLTPIDCRFKPYFVVITPKSGVMTESVYKKFDELGQESTDGTGKFLYALSFDLDPYDFLSNSLTAAAVEIEPEIERARKALASTSPMVNVSGSGSSVYAVYGSYAEAFDVLQKNKKDFEFISACVPVDRLDTNGRER